MKNAYLIMAHHNFNQLSILLGLLDGFDNDLYVHIDSKAGAIDTDALHERVKKSNLVFIPRMSITWGGDSMIWCEMELLKSVISIPHDYYHLISGDDLPIKNYEQIERLLEERPGANYVGISLRGSTSDVPKSLAKRFRYRWTLQNKVGRKRSFKAKLGLAFQKLCGVDRVKGFSGEIAKGPNWFSITDDFARYVVEREPWIHEMFSDTLCCDEVFLQTLYVNSPFGRDVAPQLDDNAMALRFIDWGRGNGQSPYTFRIDDYSLIERSSCLFARKFDADIDSEVISKISRRLQAMSSN